MPIRKFAGGGGGTDTSDATATAAQIDSGVTAYIASGKVTGTRAVEYFIAKTLTVSEIPSVSVGTAVAAL